jgi:tight adherence protein B
MNGTILIAWGIAIAAIEAGRRGVVRLGKNRILQLGLLSGPSEGSPRLDDLQPDRRRLGWPRWLGGRAGIGLLGVGASLTAGLLGLALVGPMGLVAGTTLGWLMPRALEKRKRARIERDLERQLAEIAESTAMAIRSGFSILQALEFAAEEATPPMSGLLDRFIRERRLGEAFESGLLRFADDLGTADARLFALVVTIHARSGGNLAGAIDEVADTIRHRIAVRRELRALSAQGRISGSILGALPIAFFLVLAATSRQDLGPVYRSPAGLAMISSGLVMEALAFVWIRRLLHVEA